MKTLSLLTLLVVLPLICHATIDATEVPLEAGTQTRLPGLDGRLALSSDCCVLMRPPYDELGAGAGAVITSPGGDLVPGLGNRIPYPSISQPAPGGQIVIRRGEIRLSTGDGTLPPSVSAIPEPHAYHMLLSGIVVISGLMARRK